MFTLLRGASIIARARAACAYAARHSRATLSQHPKAPQVVSDRRPIFPDPPSYLGDVSSGLYEQALQLQTQLAAADLPGLGRGDELLVRCVCFDPKTVCQSSIPHGEELHMTLHQMAFKPTYLFSTSGPLTSC